MTGGIDLGPRRRSRRPSLTPLIDVVFLLLVFFMLASRFGAETALALGSGGGGGAWEGPPRLIDVGTDGLRLNGAPVAMEDMAEALASLSKGPDDPVVLRAGVGADVQRLADVLARLEAAGFRRLVVMD